MQELFAERRLRAAVEETQAPQITAATDTTLVGDGIGGGGDGEGNSQVDAIDPGIPTAGGTGTFPSSSSTQAGDELEQPSLDNNTNHHNTDPRQTPVAAVLVPLLVLLALAGAAYWSSSCRVQSATSDGGDAFEMVDNPMPAAAAARLRQASITNDANSTAAVAAVAATPATLYATAVETGDVIYVADGVGGSNNGDTDGGPLEQQQQQQQPAVVYSVPHARRSAGAGAARSSVHAFAGLPPGGGGTASADYAVPMMEDEGTAAASAGSKNVLRTLNPLYQSADDAPPATQLVRTPNPIYVPAGNNTYDTNTTSA